MQVPIELRIRKDTRFIIESSVVFGFEVPKHSGFDNRRNFKSTTLALIPFIAGAMRFVDFAANRRTGLRL